jgi:hypothetical protein
MERIEHLKNDLREKKLVKVIAGIDNFDIEKVKRVVAAADQGHAGAVDVAARKDIIYIAKQLTDLPVFVSSVNPQELKMAAENGADVLEIGNYDKLYKDGQRISAQEVLNITSDTLKLLDEKITICVTVPGHISIGEQIELAQKLEEIGIDIIQTEGAATVEISNPGARGLLEKAQVSISNTVELVRNINIPVITASGITQTTAPMAFAAGASGVGIGTCVNKLESVIEMIAVIRATVEAVDKLRNPQKELVLV